MPSYLIPYAGADRLSQIKDPPKPKPIRKATVISRPSTIINQVCTKTNMSLERIQSGSRCADVVFARAKLIISLRDSCRLSWREIATILHRDHRACMTLYARYHE